MPRLENNFSLEQENEEYFVSPENDHFLLIHRVASSQEGMVVLPYQGWPQQWDRPHYEDKLEYDWLAVDSPAGRRVRVFTTVTVVPGVSLFRIANVFLDGDDLDDSVLVPKSLLPPLVESLRMHKPDFWTVDRAGVLQQSLRDGPQPGLGLPSLAEQLLSPR